MNEVKNESDLPEITQINNEDFITFYDGLEYLEFEGAISELDNVYFHYKGFIDGGIKDSADEEGNIKTEKVFLDGWVSVDLEEDTDFLTEFEEKGESEVSYLNLYDGTAKNKELTENDFEYYLREYNVDSSETEVYIRKSDLDRISKQYGIPKKVWIAPDATNEDDGHVTLRQETTYLNTIAVLMTHVIDGVPSKSSKGVQGFENKSRLIDYITDKYSGCPGLGERTLTAKFTQACKSLDQYMKSRK